MIIDMITSNSLFISSTASFIQQQNFKSSFLCLAHKDKGTQTLV